MALVVIEGLDGSGKGTQTALLYDYAATRGKARKINFPDYSSPSSALVKMYLSGAFGNDAEAVNAYAASTFYAVDRFASYQTSWKTDYLAGQLILADRYTTSNLVFQLCKLPRNAWDSFIDWLEDFEYEKLALPRPDRVLYLDVAPEVSQGLLSHRYGGDDTQKDIHEKNIGFLTHCRACALYAAEKLHWTVLDCVRDGAMRSIDDIQTQLRTNLEDIV